MTQQPPAGFGPETGPFDQAPGTQADQAPGSEADQTPAAEPAQPRRRRLAPSTITLVASLAVSLVCGAVLFALPVPYVLQTPGPTVDTLGKQGEVELIQVDQEPSHPITGQLRLTTVGAYGSDPGSLSVIQLVRGYFDPQDALVPYDLVYPRQSTSKQRDEQSAAEMASSQDTATVAAFEYLGLDVAIVVDKTATPAAAAVFKQGDRIVSIGGYPITGYTALRASMDNVEPGQTVEVVLDRSGTEVTVEIKTTADEATGRAMLGVSIRFEFPLSVKFGVENIGGPSAGTMFALGIIDKLGPTDLADGRIIAGTGTMAPDGKVGSIGGIRQKLVAAKRDGATVFLAPADNCKDVVGHVPDGLQVVKISTLADAVDALTALSSGKGSTLPTCTK
ncbi:MAG: PDZ domain-containing protein [Bifidobacteriaceae bacterium]|nr:PDZ domain-containing protein [Bifidobacteriaceae bacterium]